MRVDKFLKVSRIIKRRTIANEACDAGRVSINGKVVKAGAEVKIGDIIEIQFGNNTTKVEVLDLKESTKKEDAAGMYKSVGSWDAVPHPAKGVTPLEPHTKTHIHAFSNRGRGGLSPSWEFEGETLKERR